MKNTSLWLVLLLIIVGTSALFLITHKSAPPATTQTSATASSSPMITFYCLQNKKIEALFATSTVALTLSDGRHVSLPQQRMGSGIRYEATTTVGSSVEDIAFISKGASAFLTENGSQTYQQCTAASVVESGSGMQTYTDLGKTFSFLFPTTFSIEGSSEGYSTDWAVFATTSGLQLAKILVPKSYVPGTNFSDATFTVGVSGNPSALATCIQNPNGTRGTATATTINGIPFTKLFFQDAGAGNRYDTTSYRTVYDHMCYVVEYTIHYGVFQNYPAGSIQEFNEASLQETLTHVAESFQFIHS